MDISRPQRRQHPCPAATDPDPDPDPDRNLHRDGQQRALTTVRAILSNPRYTGRQVWNRQRTDHDLIDPDNTTLGTRDVTRWNTTEDWVISTTPAHPALVSEADFIAVQHFRTAREAAPDLTYLLAGVLRCGVCGRRMESCWNHQHPAYRCRHGHSSATPPTKGRPCNAYIREDQVLPHLPALLIRLARSSSSGQHSPTGPEAAERLRDDRITLTHDPAAKTVTADTPRGERIAIG
jgi:hypothetical protein